MGILATRYRRATNPYTPIASGVSCRSVRRRCGIGQYADGCSIEQLIGEQKAAICADAAENMGTPLYAARVTSAAWLDSTMRARYSTNSSSPPYPMDWRS